MADEADTVARSIDDGGMRDQSLALVAQALAVIGQHDRAEAVARSIAHPHERTKALTWMLGSWDTPLRVVASLAPALLLSMVGYTPADSGDTEAEDEPEEPEATPEPPSGTSASSRPA